MQGVNGLGQPKTVLRHLKRDELGFYERNPYIFLAAWLVFALLLVGGPLLDMLREPDGLQHLKVLQWQLVQFMVVIPLVVYFVYRQYKYSFILERLYLDISDEALTLYEKPRPPETKPRLVWTAQHADLDKVRARLVSKGGKSRFILMKKPQTPNQKFARTVGINLPHKQLLAGNWVVDDGRRRANPPSPWGLFRYASRKTMLAEIRETDLAQALIAHGYLDPDNMEQNAFLK